MMKQIMGFTIYKSIVLIICLIVFMPEKSEASSDAGIDLTFSSVHVLATYSVALDFDGAEDCIREPSCLLFDLVLLLQENRTEIDTQKDSLWFELYQGGLKPGNLLSLVRNPFEGDGDFKELYDGAAEMDLKRQITYLLGHELKIGNGKRKDGAIRLYRCENKKVCKDIMFGSLPSETMHTGYCIEPTNGCEEKPISAYRRDMKKYFSTIEP